MNWQMTRPGEVVFKKGEPFCFVMPFEHGKTEQIQPERKLLSSNKQLQDDYLAWNKSRSGFLEKLNARDQDTVKAGWQRHYMRGEKVTGDKADAHQTKRRLKPPKDV